MSRISSHPAIAIFSAIAVISTALLTSPATAQSDAYPDKPVRILVGRAPGGVADIAARVLAQRLSERWKQQTVVENRPGGTGTIAFRALVQAEPDGATLLVAPDSDMTVNRFVLKGWQASFDTDIVPVARISESPVVLIANAKLPYNTLQELVKAAKSEPGRFTFGTAGVATSPHLVGELLADRAGIEIRHIPHKGGAPAAAAAAGGHTDLAVIAVSSAAPLVAAGAVKVLGVATKARIKSHPDWPTMADGGLPEVSADIWTGLFARAGTPPAILQKLQADVAAVLADPGTVQQFESIGALVTPLFGADFTAAIKRDAERNGALIAKLKLTSK